MDEAMRGGAASTQRTHAGTTPWPSLTGDFLFSRASDILADLGPEAVRIQARTFERLVVGQIKETVGTPEGGDPVARTTSACSRTRPAPHRHLGTLRRAMFAGCDEAIVETLTLFGERIGVAFQLADDLVDLTSEDGTSGKTPGH